MRSKLKFRVTELAKRVYGGLLNFGLTLLKSVYETCLNRQISCWSLFRWLYDARRQVQWWAT